MKYYQQFLLNVIGSHENIASIESTFVMEEIKHNYSITPKFEGGVTDGSD